MGKRPALKTPEAFRDWWLKNRAHETMDWLPWSEVSATMRRLWTEAYDALRASDSLERI